jgi:ubiquinol-cytochrome c reductase cytochrome c subunit
MRRIALAVLLAAAALAVLVVPRAPAQQTPGPQTPGGAGLEAGRGAVARGRALYATSCASCHGEAGRGIPQRGPSLAGVGAAAVDFYVGTGRMPLARPGIQPPRGEPLYGRADIDRLTAYIGTLGRGGPPIPTVEPAHQALARGRELFADSCSGCHQIMGQGGIGTGFAAPALGDVTAKEIGEAIRVGPYLMPKFSERRLSDADVNAIAAYVLDVVADPPNRGGWGIGNIGPIPEGLVAFLLAGGALLVVARIIGERTPA